MLPEDNPGRWLDIRAWEVQLMIDLGLDEQSYGDLSISQRARRIVARQLPKWLETLYLEQKYG